MFKQDKSSISIFNPQSEEAGRLYHLNHYFIIAASFILLVVIAVLIYVSLKFRAKPGHTEPKQIHNNKKVEAFMIGVPFLMVAFFFCLTINIMHDTEPGVISQQPTVIINGRQWWWHVSYPGTGVVTANEIHLPAQKKVLLQLESDDVIHDWWVPSFGAKKDMVPGYKNYLWLTINKPGVYEGACSEFCGQQHAWMRIRVVAHSPADFQRWLNEKTRPAASPSNTASITGALLFNKESCAGCHSIRGTSATGTTGPDLTHLMSRKTLLAGVVENNKENLTRFLSNPPKVKPGVHMPRFIYQKDTVNALVEYLSTLK